MLTLIFVTFGLGVAMNLEAVTDTDVYIHEKLSTGKMKGFRLTTENMSSVIIRCKIYYISNGG